jgi:hypothetical protein
MPLDARELGHVVAQAVRAYRDLRQGDLTDYRMTPDEVAARYKEREAILGQAVQALMDHFADTLEGRPAPED